jgi:two-component sensor histidine kinase
MLTWIKQFQYKELFLVGFYLSFIIITFIAFIIDTLIANYFDALLDLFFVGISSAFLRYFLHSKNHKIASRAIVWIASTLVFIFVYHSEFDMSIMFTLMLPIVVFILMPPREIVINMSLYYLVLGALFFHGFNTYENHPLLHDAQTMSAYFIASLFAIAFGIFYNFAIEESHRKLEKANRQKEILLKEIHHRIKNNLNIISSILGLQQLENSHPEVAKLIEQNRLRIESIALAHEILYRSDDLEHIDFKSYIDRLGQQILFAMGKESAISLHVETKPLVFPLEIMIKIGIILNELMTNSVKYAFAVDAGEITVTLATTPTGYHMEYFDSGTAIPSSISKDALGLNLVSLTVQQLEGTLQTRPDAPYHYDIRFQA